MTQAVDAPTAQERRGKYRELEVIAKVAERCNLACSYCYYFYGGDESYKGRPPIMKRPVVDRLADFLVAAVEDFAFQGIRFVFHGGEPLLLRKADFDWACGRLREAISPHANLKLMVQTNGMLIDQEWVEIFRRHEVNVSVSLDGLETLNDEFRVDHKGRGSYHRVVAGLSKLRGDSGDEQVPAAIIGVLRAGEDYRKIIRHYIDDLKVRRLNFLLPDCSHEDGIPDGASAEDYGRILCDIYDEWVADESVFMREPRRFVSFFQNTKDNGSTNYLPNPVLIVQSDGDLTVDDSFIPAKAWRRTLPAANIFEDSLMAWFSHPIFGEIESAMNKLPDACNDCVWRNLCRGGDFENRFSEASGFNNPSVYCDGLQIYYDHASRHLAKSGLPVDYILGKLDGHSSLNSQ